jgi:hypothetical protein
MAGALASTLVAARRLERQNPAGPGLPRLFALDGRLGMPGGFCYLQLNGVVGYCAIDHGGRPCGVLHTPDHLGADGLLALGLVSATDQARVRAAQAGGSGCGSSGSACGSTACDGGSSCGGGCGGGGD